MALTSRIRAASARAIAMMRVVAPVLRRRSRCRCAVPYVDAADPRCLQHRIVVQDADGTSAVRSADHRLHDLVPPSPAPKTSASAAFRIRAQRALEQVAPHVADGEHQDQATSEPTRRCLAGQDDFERKLVESG